MDAFGVVGHVFKPRLRGESARFGELFEGRERRLVHKEVFARFEDGFAHVEPVRGDSRVGDELYGRVVQNLPDRFRDLYVGKAFQEFGNALFVGIPDVFAVRARVEHALRHCVDVPVVEPRGGEFKLAVGDGFVFRSPVGGRSRSPLRVSTFSAFRLRVAFI